MEPAACSNCSAKLRSAGVGLKSYLSSGKSSAIAVSLRPMSFQESRTTFNSGSAGLTVASFFIESWAWTANANARRTIARNGIFFISSPRFEFRKSKLSFLFRLLQSRDNHRNLVECLLPSFQLTALHSVLHGFISNEGEFRLAVPNVLKKNYVVCTLDGLMFCSLKLDSVPIRVGKVHRRNDLLVRNNLMIFTTIPALLPIRSSHAKQELPSHAKIYLANGRSKSLRPPPLHHILRICPSLPDQFARGIKNSGDNHPLRLIHRAFCHV